MNADYWDFMDLYNRVLRGDASQHELETNEYYQQHIEPLNFVAVRSLATQDEDERRRYAAWEQFED